MKMKRPDSGKQSISSSMIDRTSSVTCEADSSSAVLQTAIVCAVHETSSSPKKLSAVLAPQQAYEDVQEKWGITRNFIRNFEKGLCDQEAVYICVPKSEDNDDDHLPLKDFTLRLGVFRYSTCEFGLLL